MVKHQLLFNIIRMFTSFDSTKYDYMWEKAVAIVINGEVELAKGMKCYRISVAKPLVSCAC